MWLRLRQVCLVARELEPVVDQLEAVLGLAVAYRDPGVAHFGLENALLPVGNQLLEVVAPIQQHTAAGRYLDRRGGEGGYMVITQCDDHAPRRRRVAELGIRIAHQFEREGFQNLQLHPKDTGGSFFEIDCQTDGLEPDGPWAPAGPDWQAARRTEVVRAIRAVEIQSPEPLRTAGRWSEIAEIPLERDGRGCVALPLENASVRFVAPPDGRPEGLGGIDLEAVDRDRARAAAARRALRSKDGGIVICGTRFRLVT
ncbi:MAG: VOC family protein [Myxococcota bacterium]